MSKESFTTHLGILKQSFDDRVQQQPGHELVAQIPLAQQRDRVALGHERSRNCRANYVADNQGPLA